MQILRKGGKRAKQIYVGEKVGGTRSYSTSESVSCEASLTPVDPYYTLFVATFEPGKERGFTLEVFSDAPLESVDPGSILRLIPESVPAK